MVTSIYGAILALMFIALSVNVIKGRREVGAGIGDADDIEMKRKIRAQANLAEYFPIFLILLGFAEYEGIVVWVLHLFGIVFITGRIMHAYSLLKAEKYENEQLITNPIWRIRGMICTFAAIGLLAIIVLVKAIF